MTACISEVVIKLFKLHISSLFNFGRWYLPRRLSTSFRFYIWVEYSFFKVCLYDSLDFLGVCYVPPFSLLIS